DEEDGCKLGYGVASKRMFVVVTDRFGRFGVDPLAATLEGVGRPAQLKIAGGGAGLGLRKLVEGCDAVVVRVAPGRRTEVLCAVELSGPRRRAGLPKSVFYVQEASPDRTHEGAVGPGAAK